MATLFDTNRSRTITWDGEISAPFYYDYYEYDDPGCPDDHTINADYGHPVIQIKGPWFILDLYSDVDAPFPMLPLCGPAYPGGSQDWRYALRARITDPTYTTVYADSGIVLGPDHTGTIPGSFGDSGLGSWEATCPNVEKALADLLDPGITDSDGFPDYSFGSAKDGPLGSSIVFFERTEEDGTFSASITIDGTTASATATISAGRVFDWGMPLYGLSLYAGSSVFGAVTHEVGVTANFQGTALGKSWSHSNGGHEFDATNGAKATAAGTALAFTYSEGTSILWPDREVAIEAQLYGIGGAYPDSVDVRWLYGRAWDSLLMSWEEAARDFTASPNGTDAYAQQRWDIVADCNGSGASDSGDEYAPSRGYLLPSSLLSAGEDSGDWRLEFLGHRWLAGTLEDDDPFVIEDGASASDWSAGSHTSVSASGGKIVIAAAGGTGSATMTPASTIRPELHRCLRLRLKLTGAGPTALPITLDDGTNQRVWMARSGASGAWIDCDLDLCHPESGIALTSPDEKNSRLPLVGGEVADSWGWGVSKFDTLKIDGIPDGTTLEIEAITLERTNPLTLSILPAFEKWTELVSGGAEGIPFAWFNADGRMSDWHCQTRSGGLYSFPDIDTMLASLAASSGQTYTPEVTFDDAFHTNGQNGLWIEGGGVTWHDAGFDRALKEEITLSEVYAQARWDQVEAYPGCGDVWQTNGGGFDEALELKCAKVLRGQAAGLILKKSGPATGKAVEYQTAAGAARGSDTTDALGFFETGTPWGYGSGNHKVVWLTKESSDLANVNRWPRRVCWIAPASHGLAYAVTPHQDHYRAWADGGSVDVERADNAFTAWSAVGSPVSGEECALAALPDGVLLGVIDGGSYKVYRSTGGAWTLSYTIGGTDPENPVIVVQHGQDRLHYWREGPTVKGRRYDNADNALGAAFSVSGIPAVDDAGLAGGQSVGPTGGLRVHLVVVVSGSKVTYTSTDGEAFS